MLWLINDPKPPWLGAEALVEEGVVEDDVLFVIERNLPMMEGERVSTISSTTSIIMLNIMSGNFFMGRLLIKHAQPSMQSP